MSKTKKIVRLVRAIMRSGTAQPLRVAGWTDAQLIELLVVTVADLRPTDLACGIRCVLGVHLTGAELVELDRSIYADADTDTDDDDDDDDDDDRSALSRVFASAWDVVALRGQCDERGGAEYHRLLRVWLDAPGESGVVSWIRAAVRQPDRAPSAGAQSAVDPVDAACRAAERSMQEG